MAWGGGTYIKPYTWTAGTPILATDHNAQDTDFTNGINNCLAKDGQNAMTGNLSLGGNILTNVGAGSAATPSFSPGADVDTGIFLAGTNALGYATGGVERMRISNAGQVGVGTTAPLDMLDVSSAAATFRARIRNSTANEAYALFQNTATGTTTTDGLLAGIDYLGAGYFWNHENQPNVFATNNVERMRVAANGNVGIGTTNPLDKLDVSSNAGTFRARIQNSTANEAFLLFQNTTTGTATTDGFLLGIDGSGAVYNYNQDNAGMLFGTNNILRMQITSGGTTQPGADDAYTLGANGVRWSAVWAVNGTIQTSDNREKNTIADSVLGLNFIKSLRPVSYRWNVGGNIVTSEIDENGNATQVITPKPGTRTHWGLIAQEVKAAVDDAGVDFGGWVLTDKDDPDSQQALRYDQFIAPLIQAVKELTAKVESLEAQVASLAVP